MGLFNKDVKNENKISDISATTEESRVIKRLYLVDYENVSDAGLVGVDQLAGNDIVVIFYGSKVKTVAYESLIAQEKSLKKSGLVPASHKMEFANSLQQVSIQKNTMLQGSPQSIVFSFTLN